MADRIEVDMIVEAVSKGFEQLTGKIGGLGKAGQQSADKLASANKRATGSVTDFYSALGIANQVMAYAGRAYSEIIGETVDYAMAVKDSARAMGASTEEASALIQIADDTRIEISTLKVAFRNLNDEGIAPNITNLKKLADKYNALPTSVEKAQFAAEMFGMRAGPEMQKMLEMGSTAIDEMAESAQRAGLIMSEEGVAAAERYRLALDEMNDSWMGLKITAGTAVLPILSDFISNFTALSGAVLRGGDVTQVYNEILAEERRRLGEVVDVTAVAAYEMELFRPAMYDVSQATYETANALEVARYQMDQIPGAANAYSDSLRELYIAEQDVAAAQRDLAAAQQEWAQSVGADAANKLEEAGVKGDKYREALDLIDQVMGTQLGMQADYNTKLADLAQKYADGKITGDEFKTTLGEIASEFEPLSEKVQTAINKVAELETKLNALDGKVINAYVNIHTSGTIPGGGGGGEKRQHGGPVWGNHPYIVGERGPELFIPRTGGQVIPNHQLTSGGDTIIEAVYITAAGANFNALIRQAKAKARSGQAAYGGQ